MDRPVQATTSQTPPSPSDTLSEYIGALVPSLLLTAYGVSAWTVATKEQGLRYVGAVGLAYILIAAFLAGPLFSRIRDRIPGPYWLRGVVFAIACWFVHALVVEPALGLGPFSVNLTYGVNFAFSLDLALASFFFLLWGAIIGPNNFFKRALSLGIAPSLILAFYGDIGCTLAHDPSAVGYDGKFPAAPIGALAYFLVGTLICAPLFAAFHNRVPGTVWSRGLIFGLVLWLIDMIVVSPIIGNGVFDVQVSKSLIVISIVAFVWYGAILSGLHIAVYVKGQRPLATVSLSLLELFIMAVFLRTVLFQPSNVTGGGMLPAASPGSVILVAKYAYGYSHYSLPLSPPVFSGRVLSRQPARGDVVLFRLPKNDFDDRIGRIVGLSGDRIQMVGGVLNINGTPVKQECVEDFVADQSGAIQRVKQFRETLPNGVSYPILDLTDNGFYDNTQVYTVPPAHYFMMGDNRDNSTDSRVLSEVGYVPFENIVGRLDIVIKRVARAPM